MNIYILGVDHGIQHRDGLTSNSHARFETLLRELVREHHVTFIGDETLSDRNAIAKEMAKPPDLIWEPIEMSKQMRIDFGIDAEQTGRPWDEIVTPEGRLVRKYKRVPSDAVREDYMVNCAIQKAGSAESVLILCGLQHGPELRDRFQRLGHHVTLDSLCKRSWYKNSDCED